MIQLVFIRSNLKMLRLFLNMFFRGCQWRSSRNLLSKVRGSHLATFRASLLELGVDITDESEAISYDVFKTCDIV